MGWALQLRDSSGFCGPYACPVGKQSCRAARWAGVLVLGLWAAPVGASSAGSTARSSSAGRARHGGARACAHHPRRCAKRDAAAELAAVQLPPMATRVGGDRSVGRLLGPRSARPAFAPGCDHMPYDSAYWTAPRKPHWLTGWFERHRPVGSTFSGSGYGSGPSYIVYGVMFDFPDKREVPIREVTVSLAAAKGGGSAIRANGLAVWQRPNHPFPCWSAGPQGTASR